MIIGIDVDGVLLDIHTPWLEKYNAASGDNLTVDRILSYRTENYILPEFRSVFASMRSPDLYDVVEPIDGAVAAVRWIVLHGHVPVVITHDYRTHIKSKRAALDRHFGCMLPYMVAIKAKYAVSYDILIDDAPHNMPDVLFSQPWNKSFGCHIYRADDWQHAIDIIRSLS